MPILRPQYQENQTLRANDLKAEQRWRRTQHQRHLLQHHGAGIVHGLSLGVSDDALDLAPGLAIDREGRELRLVQGVNLPFTSLAESARQLTDGGPPVVLDLWLHRGVEQSLGQRPAEIPDRRISHPVLRLQIADDPGPGIFLGRIAPKLTGGAVPRYALLHTPGVQRYASSVGAHLTSPSGDVNLDLGGAQVGIWQISTRDSEGRSIPRLTLDPHRGHRLSGALEARGHLATTTASWGEAKPAAGAAIPWSLRRTATEAHSGLANSNQSTGTNSPGSNSPEALRLELASQGAGRSAENSGLSLGRRNTDGAFQSILRISHSSITEPSGTTTVAGHLVLKGRLIESSIRADADDPRFAAQLNRHWQLGVEASVAQTLVRRHAPINLGVKIRGIAGPPSDNQPSALHHAYYVTNLGTVSLCITLEARDAYSFQADSPEPTTLTTDRMLAPRESFVLLRTLELPSAPRGVVTTTLVATGWTADGRTTRTETQLPLSFGPAETGEETP